MIIPRVFSDFCGIGLTEALWKTVMGIINLRLTSAIAFHDTLHVFRVGWVMSTASLGAKILRHLTEIRGGIL